MGPDLYRDGVWRQMGAATVDGCAPGATLWSVRGFAGAGLHVESASRIERAFGRRHYRMHRFRSHAPLSVTIGDTVPVTHAKHLEIVIAHVSILLHRVS